MADPVTQSSDDLKHVLDAARSALDREFQRAERFDAKARGQATLAGSWFAVTQAVAAVSSQAATTPKGWLIALVVILVFQAAALAGLLVMSARVWRLQERRDITDKTLEDMEKAAKAQDPTFASDTLGLYRYVLYYAQAANAKRAEAFEATNDKWCSSKRWASASSWWWPVLGLGFTEIFVALLSRVFS